MIKKQDILKMSRAIFRRSSGYKDRKVIHPHREWFVGILLFFVVAIAGALINARVHNFYTALDETVVVERVAVTKYDSVSAETAQQFFAARQATFDTLIDSAPVIVPVATSTNDSASSTDETTDEEGIVENEIESGEVETSTEDEEDVLASSTDEVGE